MDAKALRDQSTAPTPVTAVSPTFASEDTQIAAQQPTLPLPRTEPVAARESVAQTEEEADSVDLQEVAVTGSRARRAPGRTAGPRNTISGLSSEARQRAAHAAAQAEHPNPDEWLEEIRDLRRKGKITDADREWQLFSEAYPDFQVAPDDIARKQP